MNTPVVICETDVLHAAKALSSPPWYGEFVIEADGEVIEFVYHTGIGSKNSMGFGTVTEKLTGIK